MSGSGRRERESRAKDKQGSLDEWVREERERAEPRISKVHLMSGSGRRERESRAKDKQGSLDEWVREEGEQSQG